MEHGAWALTDDPDVEELRGEAAHAHEAAGGCVELHDAEEESHRRRRVEALDGGGPTRGTDPPRAEVSGKHGAYHDRRVRKVERRRHAVLELVPSDEQARNRPIRECNGVEAVLGPDAAALSDALNGYAKYQRGRGQHRVRAEAGNCAAIGLKRHVGAPDIRKAVDDVQEGEEAEHLVNVALVLLGEEGAQL